jgi:choline dehydrogenase-like flavoprotein
MASFDTIIVGAGSAGSVLAGRLSEDRDRRILVLEAGERDRNWLLRVPLGVGKVWNGTRFNWSYESEPEPHADNRAIYHPRGKVVGGSSSINMMAYVRGHRRDFDRWRQMGLDGWSYADVLPYFKRSEAREDGGDDFHGGDGPLGTVRGSWPDPIYDAFLEAGRELGHPSDIDYNGADQEGFARMQYTIRDGRRCSAAVAYLHPAVADGRVSVETDVHVTRVLMEGTRAVGVEYVQNGQKREARADDQVIVSTGAINSPQLLMLSGIGPADHLKDVGIEPVVDLAGVGQNLQDHPAVPIGFAHARPSGFQNHLRLDRLALSMLQAHWLRSGFAVHPPGGMTAFVKSDPALDIPDIQLFFRNGGYVVQSWFPGFRRPAPDGFMFRGCQLRPESRGSVSLASDDPMAPPRILNNFLSTETDRRVLRACVRLSRDIAATKAFQGIVGAETMPGDGVQSDDDIDAFARSELGTVYHPIATCRMGTDPESVVDADFRVRGTDSLRVVDASVMPDLVGGNINAAVIMIAEKASDIIRGRAPLPAMEDV